MCVFCSGLSIFLATPYDKSTVSEKVYFLLLNGLSHTALPLLPCCASFTLLRSNFTISHQCLCIPFCFENSKLATPARLLLTESVIHVFSIKHTGKHLWVLVSGKLVLMEY